MNLERREKTAALISLLVIRQADVSTCQHSVYNIDETKRRREEKEEMINDSSHHLLAKEEKNPNDRCVCVCVRGSRSSTAA